MTDPKPLASLSPSLLARKGAARPAMRPQLQPLYHFREATARQIEDDLGWNDMGHEFHAPEPDGVSAQPEAIGPEPVETAEVVAINPARRLVDQLGAAVRADIVEGSYLSIATAYDQQRRPRELEVTAHEAARLGQLAGMADMDPAFQEHRLAFELEIARIIVGLCRHGVGAKPGQIPVRHPVKGGHDFVHCANPLDLLPGA